MNDETFSKVNEDMLKTCQAILHGKGKEYANSEDRLANFKRASKNLQITPEKVLAVYAGKHWDSICNFINKLDMNTTSGELIAEIAKMGEGIDSRITDMINYMLLLNALIKERLSKK